MNSMVYGNLALSPQEQSSSFSVVPGGKQSYTVTPERQFFAPDVYPRVIASPSRLSTKMFVAVLALVLTCSLGAAFIMSGVKTAARNASIEETAQTEVKVQPGESLWSLAETHPINDLNTSETVEVIKSWNDLSSSALQPGESLIVPAVS